MATLVDHVRATIDVSRQENLTILAASLAYYAFVSVVPILLLVISVGSVIGGQAFTREITSTLSVYLSSAGQQIVAEVLNSTAHNVGAGLLGILVLVWGALKVFRGMKVAFVEIYDAEPEVSLVKQVKDGLAVAVTVGLAVVAMVGISALRNVAPILSGNTTFVVVSVAGLLAGLICLFFPLYYVLPPDDVSLRTVLPGTVLAAVSWICLQMVFRIYVGRAEKYAVLGVLGAVVLFLTWLYFASIVLLVGAAVNATLAGRGV
ncbi:hypothetical protein BV210_16735 [Halorientalis sp. IM1011]|uniref:YihY/virulence factor BrkB family protein n=1 Tax=Halorientalis sp. IM1011 TaxID=1932360 RepID=UPI00097CCB96|nr:YihY/virulence factor BrkB family protein [Halorientalis sp. IM1011]AQL44258.1 hypothetical protein BV210_16735 [Halorientalis sp. IM1011]